MADACEMKAFLDQPDAGLILGLLNGLSGIRPGQI